MHQRLFKGAYPDVAAGLSSLARTRQALGKTAEARQGFDEAVAMAEKSLPPEHPQLKEYRETLAKCMAALAEQAKPAAKGGGG